MDESYPKIAKNFCQSLYQSAINSYWVYSKAPYTREENNFAETYVLKLFLKGKIRTLELESLDNDTIHQIFSRIDKQEKCSVDNVKLKRSLSACSHDIRQFHHQGIKLGKEIEKEDSLSPAAVRMAKRVLRNIKYNYTVSTSSPSPPPEKPKSISLPSPTNSEVCEIGNQVCDDAFHDFISKYSSTISTDKNWVRKYKNFKDIEPDFLQVKPNITKNLLARDLRGCLKPNERRNSLHYSHKRIKMLKRKKSLPRKNFDNLEGIHKNHSKGRKRKKRRNKKRLSGLLNKSKDYLLFPTRSSAFNKSCSRRNIPHWSKISIYDEANQSSFKNSDRNKSVSSSSDDAERSNMSKSKILSAKNFITPMWSPKNGNDQQRNKYLSKKNIQPFRGLSKSSVRSFHSKMTRFASKHTSVKMTEKSVQAPTYLSELRASENQSIPKSSRRGSPSRRRHRRISRRRTRIRIPKNKIKRLHKKFRKIKSLTHNEEQEKSETSSLTKRIPKIMLNNASYDKGLPAPRQLYHPDASRKNSDESDEHIRANMKKKINKAIDGLIKDKSFINLSISQKAGITNSKKKVKNLSRLSYTNLNFDPRIPINESSKEQEFSPDEIKQRPKIVKKKKLKIRKRKSAQKSRKSMLNNSSVPQKYSNLNLTASGIIDIDYTYQLIKKLKNLKSAKNAEFRGRMASPPTNSTILLGTNISNNVNLVSPSLHFRPRKSSKERIYGNKIMNQLADSTIEKKKKKWSKILSFFQNNTDQLVNLIPSENPKPTIFGLSKRILTRPKSYHRFRPYSVSNKRSHLASSGWLKEENKRPSTQNAKIRPKNFQNFSIKNNHFKVMYQKHHPERSRPQRGAIGVIEMNTFSINSGDNTN
ncbi:unnamed protein product [Moneuplotes crassus]|uniref:Uncharacterized protein n=1 Tax=Euplotes crassus TaxID=5936 RepID=A0AAD2D459_EUPCR|nr:unnamed protein product [Moneuplotes crassus]